jgi:preprotein translocase subunit SecY
MATPGKMPNMNKKGLGELWARLRFLFLAIIVYRIGTHIPVPGLDPERLASLFNQNQGTILGLFNMFSGGALERMSILALGIMPYISASIIMQLLSAVVPTLEQLKKRGRCWASQDQSVHSLWHCAVGDCTSDRNVRIICAPSLRW